MVVLLGFPQVSHVTTSSRNGLTNKSQKHKHYHVFSYHGLIVVWVRYSTDPFRFRAFSSDEARAVGQGQNNGRSRSSSPSHPLMISAPAPSMSFLS